MAEKPAPVQQSGSEGPPQQQGGSAGNTSQPQQGAVSAPAKQTIFKDWAAI